MTAEVARGQARRAATAPAQGAPRPLRTALRPGDIGELVRLHGELYAAEQGFDVRFEAYVAGTFAEWIPHRDPRTDRIWLAESAAGIIGSVAIVGRGPGVAQLRWLLVHPSARGAGLGRRLVREAVEFCRATDQRRIYLLTVRELPAAARLYREAGFEVVSTEPEETWGRRVVSERYELRL